MTNNTIGLILFFIAANVTTGWTHFAMMVLLVLQLIVCLLDEFTEYLKRKVKP